ncbi:hypothetical protein T492DRAFT_836013 [Pavlovales sp. CCMP2436]|nr:hypothetical protein T492DRAFT_836013 [Pavlovales sp. CCMP2436]
MQALGKALPPSPPSALAAVRELPTTRKDTANARKLAATLAEKAHLYRRSVFCLIAPGDSVVTVRIASAAAALCIPVLLFPRAFLPFAQSVAWANVSLHLDAEALVEYANDPRGRRNPLLALHELATREPKRLRAMQLALADARWLLHYRSGGRPVQGAPEPPSAGDALVQQLVRAAKQRLRAARGGTDAGACGKATLGDITLYRR